MLISSAKPNPPAKQPIRGVKDAVVDAMTGSTDLFNRAPAVEFAAGVGMAVSRGLHTFPNFVYPTVLNANAAERAQIYGVLDGLPLKDVNAVKTISMVEAIPSDKPGWVINGRAWDRVFTSNIELSREQLTTPEKLRGTLTHEVGHTVDYKSKWFGLFGDNSTHDPWGKGPHITDYATTNRKEDYAESYEEYHIRPDNLKDKNPAKYEYLDERNHQNFMERLIDRPEFRETGKYLGEHLASNETTRNVVQGAYYLSSVFQGVLGLGQLYHASETGDSRAHYQGMLNTAAGVMFASGMMAIPGMALQGANTALTRAIARGEISADDADGAVRLATDPGEKLLRKVGSEMGLMKPFRELQAKNPKRMLAAGIATGGAVGGLTGALAGPYAGVMAGYHLAGPAGGAAGMVVGGMAGYLLGTDLGGRAGGAVARMLGA
ncbi:MAG: hypothetical protein KC910_08195 [Candidatus Eremiobacteraeota bacterium]|nr:hypothetical protein [Candidatus Eremiobacteraeota bacterium]